MFRLNIVDIRRGMDGQFDVIKGEKLSRVFTWSSGMLRRVDADVELFPGERIVPYGPCGTICRLQLRFVMGEEAGSLIDALGYHDSLSKEGEKEFYTNVDNKSLDGLQIPHGFNHPILIQFVKWCALMNKRSVVIFRGLSYLVDFTENRSFIRPTEYDQVRHFEEDSTNYMFFDEYGLRCLIRSYK